VALRALCDIIEVFFIVHATRLERLSEAENDSGNVARLSKRTGPDLSGKRHSKTSERYRCTIVGEQVLWRCVAGRCSISNGLAGITSRVR
jgi:hypothetical protein